MKKKKLFLISLALAMLLAVFTSPAVIAAKQVPFSANGTISAISPGDVSPAGSSGRWVVAERELDGMLSGDINGEFTMTYKANVELETQAGTLKGTLEVGSYILKVNGKIKPLEFVGWHNPHIPLYKLTICGGWDMIKGQQGTGDYEAWVIFIPTPEGHVGYVVDSAIDLTGKWQLED